MSSFDLLAMNRQHTDNPIYIYNSGGDRTDISNTPIPQARTLEEIVSNGTITRTGKTFDSYMYNGVKVPRVTSILEYCSGNKDFLLNWASKLGPDYRFEKERTLEIGHKLHEAIAEYLSNGTLYTIQHLRGYIKKEVSNCFKNFLAWHQNLIRNGYTIRIIASEVPLICPWFAGTADLLIELNGRKYVVDFKSSKHITPEYIIQASAYKWIIDNYYVDEYGHIDGIGVVRFDKVSDVYEDIFFDESDSRDAQIIYNSQFTFANALNTLYAMNSLNNEFKAVKKYKAKNQGSISKSIKSSPEATKTLLGKKEKSHGNSERNSAA